ncbi:DUF2207 domain-containing protein [Candidatus Mycosynbacter amalyticus]|uniref:DUF2207 domain-containing protein n=1 Tax=Candidatus Mycosynbacter amalyticus TaxID=2665156 RepID=A0A857ML71_9BACT|nr:DUF2207 domain-containing protein [Candidatus Mycosynbacter amalyticus]QHN42535.1 DUF2207 domain-containing protein [Candidatus Mycosynbacter amalyticus]
MRFKFFASIFVVGLSLVSGQPTAAAANDFEITNYHMQLELGRDSEQRSTLKTVEKITALFPDTDQNHGIERAIPSSYEGHTTSLHIESVKSEAGVALPYTIYESNGNQVVRIGDKNTYVHGSQTYVLTYAQRDVTRYYADTKMDEFYWDLNGVDWKVPIQRFTAEVTMTPEARTYYEQYACYQGGAGSSAGCQITQEGAMFRVAASSMAPGDNVTVALGFRPGAFATYQPSLWERLVGVWIGLLAVTGLASVGLIVWLSVRWSRLKNRVRDIGTIVPEYLPPKAVSVTASAEVLDSPRAVFAAQLLDLAVRHYLKIYETKPKSFWSNAQYTLEITGDVTKLRAEEQELLRDIYDGKTSVGEKLEMKTLQSNTALYSRMQDNPKKLQALVRGEYALRERLTTQRAWFTRTSVIVFLIAIVTGSPFLLVAAGTAWLLGYSLWSLTDKGLSLRRYLEGLKLYIGVAEVERLKMLQTPEGAEKVGTDIEGKPAELVKLYEKVLPYAVLFGQEKEWGKQLGEYYAESRSNPGWYSGGDATVFNAAVLSSAIGNFTTASSYTSASSSSSGGSGGGGSSGGGGGGGGGGGW